MCWQNFLYHGVQLYPCILAFSTYAKLSPPPSTGSSHLPHWSSDWWPCWLMPPCHLTQLLCLLTDVLKLTIVCSKVDGYPIYVLLESLNYLQKMEIQIGCRLVDMNTLNNLSCQHPKLFLVCDMKIGQNVLVQFKVFASKVFAQFSRHVFLARFLPPVYFPPNFPSHVFSTRNFPTRFLMLHDSHAVSHVRKFPT